MIDTIKLPPFMMVEESPMADGKISVVRGLTRISGTWLLKRYTKSEVLVIFFLSFAKSYKSNHGWNYYTIISYVNIQYT